MFSMRLAGFMLSFTNQCFKMKCQKSMKKVLFFFLVFFLTKETCTQECGWAYRVEGFIREKDAMEGSWPWMVSIMKSGSDGQYTQFCSGSMITSKHVLTAAHCFDGRKSSLYKAKTGNVDDRFAQEYSISRIKVHSRYRRGRFYHDIAILTLGKNVDPEDFNPICLPQRHELVNLTGKYTTVVGWGLTTPSEPIYPKLREQFGLVVVSNSRCNESIFENNIMSTFPQGISDGMICTNYSTECIGSSGSPLMYHIEDQWYVVGVKSFGWSCDASDFPTGYVRVSNYINWIERNTKLGCGWSNKENASTGNGETEERPWQWMVAIVMQNSKGNFDHLCSGSLISKKHVLTAAHCFGRNNLNMYKARIGNVHERLGELYNFVRITIHEGYASGRFYDDIAILTLEREVKTRKIYPVCLPHRHDLVNLLGKHTTVVGWERYLSPNQTYPNLKEDNNLVVIANSRCQEKFNRLNYFKKQFPQGITDGVLCTYCASECVGESGSPLMYRKNFQWYVVGLTSFGTDCGVPDFPVGYTRVSKYLEWIDKNIKG